MRKLNKETYSNSHTQKSCTMNRISVTSKED